MSGVWTFNNGVVRLPGGSARDAASPAPKVLVHVPSGEVISSYDVLSEKLSELGWVKYEEEDDPDLLLRFRRESTNSFISLPHDFSNFKVAYMYDVVAKNGDVFMIRHAIEPANLPAA